MKIIETPFSKITATVVVELRNSATKVKSMAIFSHRQIFNGFPLPVFYFRRFVTLHLHQEQLLSLVCCINAWVVLAVFAGWFCVAGPVFYFSHYSSPLE
ncbi:hypothetical protein K6R56_000817 [Escherichia coli]|uniref:hypothetical protein n=1 Tax=Escherichia coli TaxID=562 RepID=UPI001485A24F|nr:hypothetical protein [Escherichia coli]EHZ8231086.1 hypothetical protein [Escherichia coli]UUN40003.1 hypothetical protein A7A20_08550 [Escherichia coli]HAW3317564.1 hypothetical protein [Escherichia coli]